MRVYAETNFLVEVALAQEEAAICQEIVSFCEAGSVELIFPAFSMPEAYHALVGKQREREKFSGESRCSAQEISKVGDVRSNARI